MGKDDSRKFLVKEDGTTEFEKTKVKEAVVKSEEKKVGGTLLGLRVPGVTSALEIPEKDFQEGRRTAIGDIVERPGAAVRAGARGLIPGGEKPLEAFQRASIDPGTEPRFQDSFLDQTPLGQLNAAIQRGNIPANKLTSGLAFAEEVGRGFVPSSAGLLADTLSNPFEVALMLVGAKSIQGAFSKLANTKTGKFISRIANTDIEDLPIIRNITNSTRQGRFANKMNNAAFNAKTKHGTAFREAADDIAKSNPTARTNGKVAQTRFKKDLVIGKTSKGVDKFSPGVKSKLNSATRRSKTGTLDRFVNEEGFADNMTLRDTIDLKQDIRRIPGFKAKLAKGRSGVDPNWDSTDLPFIDLMDELTSAQLKAFPGMKPVNAAYSQALDDYALVKNFFKRGKVLNNIKRNFGGDPQVLDAINSLLDPKVMREIGGFQKTFSIISQIRPNLFSFGTTALKGAAKAGLIAGGVAGGLALKDKLFPSEQISVSQERGNSGG